VQRGGGPPARRGAGGTVHVRRSDVLPLGHKTWAWGKRDHHLTTSTSRAELHTRFPYRRLAEVCSQFNPRRRFLFVFVNQGARDSFARSAARGLSPPDDSIQMRRRAPRRSGSHDGHKTIRSLLCSTRSGTLAVGRSGMVTTSELRHHPGRLNSVADVRRGSKREVLAKRRDHGARE